MVRLNLIEAGRSRQLEVLARRRGRWRWIDFPATVAVVEHPEHGVLLFDTGYARRFFAATQRYPQRLYRWLVPARLASGEPAAEQLGRLGIAPDRVVSVLLSHLHGDHLAGLQDFPAARVLLSEHTDLHGVVPGRRARGPAAWRATGHGFLPELLPDDLASRRTPIEALPVLATGLPGFDTGHDLFGDGSAVAVPLPGHAPGHFGLWLPATQGPPVLLVGDACWLAEAFRNRDLPPAPVLALMGDSGGYLATIEALAALVASRPEVLVVPSHCAASVAVAREVLAG